MPPKPKSSQPGSIVHTELNIKDIILSDKNPRQINEKEFKQLCASIKKDPAFLFQRPPLINEVNGKYHCYAGHMRVRAAEANGLTTVPCFIEKDVPAKVQDERMIRDNTHSGVWDADALANQWNVDEVKEWGVKDYNFNVMTDLLEGAHITKDDDNSDNNTARITDEGKAQFSLVMNVENKEKLVSTLNKIRERHNIMELELALMNLVDGYANF